MMLSCCYDEDAISIHSPHARGDDHDKRSLFCDYISIHSPHARGDKPFGNFIKIPLYFNPLPSCEGRPYCHYD